MAENVSDCRGFRVRVNGEYTHVCDRCSTARSDVNFGLSYEGSKETWRDGVRAAAARQVAEARAAGLDPAPLNNRWV